MFWKLDVLIVRVRKGRSFFFFSEDGEIGMLGGVD